MSPVDEAALRDDALATSRYCATLGQRPVTVWLTGLSGAGKSTLARGVRERLRGLGKLCCMLDGDALRKGLCSDLGFTPDERDENIRRAAESARLLNEQGLIVIASFISPYRRERSLARSIVGASRFVEVYVNTPVAICEARDPKELYRRARAGELRGFTGVDAPYEPPASPSIVIDTGGRDRTFCTEQLLARLLPMIVRPVRQVA
ncbi:adenylyl-sulfate kinase [Paraburkholderia strydomiana]|jgi:adenylylsulfate kinase|uniref:Adenylyl-sulfate kinase n=1 Tax=Paraburkholderia strydomiana TaxID=1245417 RepID=A0ABW9EPX0_9BURK